MPRRYDKNFKAMIVNLVMNEKHSTIKTAEQFDINKTNSRKRAKDYSMNEDTLLEYIVKGSMPKLYNDPSVNKDTSFLHISKLI